MAAAWRGGGWGVVSTWLLVFGIVLPWLVVALAVRVGYLLVRQNGRVLLRLERLEELLDAQRPAAGVIMAIPWW